MDANGYLIYDAATGSPYDDSNSSNRGGKIHCATLGTTNHPTLAFSHIVAI